jgi:hypothetical protein
MNAARHALSFVAGVDEKQFRRDSRTRSAVLYQLVVDRSQEPLRSGQQRRVDPAFRTDARSDRQALAGENRPEALRQVGREDRPHPSSRLAQAGSALDLDLSGVERLAHAA